MAIWDVSIQPINFIKNKRVKKSQSFSHPRMHLDNTFAKSFLCHSKKRNYNAEFFIVQ